MKHTNWIINLIIILLLLAVFRLYLPLAIDRFYGLVDSPIEIEKPLEVSFTPLDVLLDDLAYCESRNRDDIKIVDTNGYYSYGRYQYQLYTWNYYIEKYDLLPEAEVYEYKNLIQDGDFQRHVTKTILENEPSAWSNWYTCGRHIGLDIWANKTA